MERREFLYFEWVVVDGCNLNCAYCVNSGYSQRPSDKREYVPGRELEMAAKIVELGKNADRVSVNLTGGEPLLAEKFPEMLQILSKAPNISIQIISNMRLMDKLRESIEPYLPVMSLVGSLHVTYRTDKEIDRLIAFLNGVKGRLRISLSQVDCALTADDRAKLARITKETGLDIGFQTFIPPYEERKKDESWSKRVSDSHFVSTLGKRCCLGYSHFLLWPDGKLIHGLWCSEKTGKSGDFLGLTPENFDKFVFNEMRKCPATSCGCNYNTLNYEEYLAACRRLGYSKEEMFARENVRLSQRILRRLTSMKVALTARKR